MKKFAILLTILAFISACSDSDLGDHSGAFSADVSGKKHNSGGPYLIGDNNSLTARLASCSRWSNGAIDSISTDLSHSAATNKVTMTVTINANDVTSHSITVNIDDFMNHSDDMEDWLCDWIRAPKYSDQIENKRIW